MLLLLGLLETLLIRLIFLLLFLRDEGEAGGLINVLPPLVDSSPSVSCVAQTLLGRLLFHCSSHQERVMGTQQMILTLSQPSQLG